MSKEDIETSIAEFRQINGIGRKLAEDFVIDLGFRNIRDVKGKNPDKLYLQLKAKKGKPLCKCVLYCIRSVVAYAQKPHDKSWFDFKDCHSRETCPRENGERETRQATSMKSSM